MGTTKVPDATAAKKADAPTALKVKNVSLPRAREMFIAPSPGAAVKADRDPLLTKSKRAVAKKEKYAAKLDALPKIQLSGGVGGMAPGQDRVSTILRRTILNWQKTAFSQLRGEFFPLEGGPLNDLATTEPTAWVPLAETGTVSTDLNGILRMQFFPQPNDMWCVGSGGSTFGVPGVTGGCRGFTAWPKLQGINVSDAVVDGYRVTGFRVKLRAICNSFNNQGTVAVGLVPHQSGFPGYPSTAQISTFPYSDRWSVADLQTQPASFVMLFASTIGDQGGWIREAFRDLYGAGGLIPHSPYSPTIFLSIDGAATSTTILEVTVEAAFECTLDSRLLTGDGNATANALDAPQSMKLSPEASDSLARAPEIHALAKKVDNGDTFVDSAIKWAQKTGHEAMEEVQPILDELGGMTGILKKIAPYAGTALSGLLAL